MAKKNQGDVAVAEQDTGNKPVKATQGQARMVAQVRRARATAVPVIAVTTADQYQTLRLLYSSIAEQLVAEDMEAPALSWDILRGLVYLNDAGRRWLATLDPDDLMQCKLNPFKPLELVKTLPEHAVVFYLNAHRWIADGQFGAIVMQGIANLRDEFKEDARTLMLLAPAIALPPELTGDVVVFDEPLPQGDELAAIVRDVHEYSGVTTTDAKIQLAVEAVQGLPSFQAEQVTAMSMRSAGIDLDSLWEHKRKLIEQTPGLSVSREGITFDDIGGCDVVKDFLRALCAGNDRPNAVVFIDEIEKMLAGAGGDTSGTSQDQLGTLLTEMQDGRAVGVLLVGHPGGGKSATAKATGNDAGIPTIKLDLGASKGGLVGQSEAQIRSALKTIRTVSNGRALWIATCNSMGNLPLELQRRFKYGPFFFDLPTKAERDAIWTVHREKYGIDAHDPGVSDDGGWTGAEIEKCCELAWRLNRSLEQAATFVVPIAVSAKDRIEALRAQADGKWQSASEPGTYRRCEAAQPQDKASTPKGRRMKLTE